MTSWFDWISAHQAVLGWLVALSALTFLVSLLLVPLLVARLPRDYFQKERRPHTLWATQHSALRAALIVVKNAAGVVFVIAGLVMLVIPGQGVVSILIGLALLDFPGKFRLERWLIKHPPVLSSMNWIRRRANQEPLIIYDAEPADRDESGRSNRS